MKKILIILLTIIPLLIFGETPSWVTRVDLTQDFPEVEKSEDGAYFHQYNREIKISDYNLERYSQSIIELINITGVEDYSQITIRYNASFETAELLSITVKRDGILIDKLTDSNIKTFDVEDQDMQQLYLGEKKLTAILNDIRVGDIIEYSYIIKGKNPVYDNYFSQIKNIGWSVEVGSFRLKVLNYSSNELNFNGVNTDLKPVITEKDGYTEYLWQDSWKEYVNWEENTPNWYSSYPYIELSTIDSWKSVQIWAEALFSQDLGTFNMEEFVYTIVNKDDSPKEQVAKLLLWVEENIRYLGVQIGENSHKPSLPSITLERRYGDCKDKVYLLNALLTSIDIKSTPVLVSTYDKGMVDSFIPNINMFNHVIIYVEVDGKAYFFDPTKTYQAGTIDTISQPYYGKGLLLDSSIEPFVIMENSFTDIKKSIVYQFDLTTESTELTVTSNYYNSSADYQRYYYSISDIKDIQQDYLDYYREDYSGVNVLNDIVFQDYPQENRISIVEKYSIEDFIEISDDETSIDLYPNEFTSFVDFNSYVDRTTPLKLDYPENVQVDMVVMFNPLESGFKQESYRIKSQYHEFLYSSTFASNTLRNSYIYTTFKDYIEAEDVESFFKETSDIADNIDYSYYTYEEKSSKSFVSTDVEDSNRYRILIGIIIIIYLVQLLVNRRRKSKNNTY